MASGPSTFNLVPASLLLLLPLPLLFFSSSRRRSNGLETASRFLDPLGRSKGFFHRFPPGAGVSFDRWEDSGRVLGID